MTDFQATPGWLTCFLVSDTGSPRKKLIDVKVQKQVETVILRHFKHNAKNPTSRNVSLIQTLTWMTLYEKKNLKIRTTNFAISKMKCQVAWVSVKTELTVCEKGEKWDETAFTTLARNFFFSNLVTLVKKIQQV